MGLDVRLKTARLYLLTDLREDTKDFGNFVEAAFAGGVDVLQVRQKDLPEEKELEALDLARTIAYHYQGLVVVNDSPALAKKFSADVLHLGQADEQPKVARTFLHQWALIGQSTHSDKQARAAVDNPEVNYFCVGPVYATSTKPEYPPVGLDLVRAAATLAPPSDPATKPWFAIGGINADNLDEVLAAGARRIAVSSAITRAADAEAAAKQLSDRLRETWNDDPGMQEYLQSVFNFGQSATFVPVQDKSGGGNQPETISEEMADEPRAEQGRRLGSDDWGQDTGARRFRRDSE
ncbi:thiamine phosphate synthase [Naumannella sp. ID2617S]|nr:thiamine phosphate synthase [Naumannella sp. ID2617S]